MESEDIFAKAWNHAATVGNAVSGFKSSGIFSSNPNQHPELVFSPETVHLHSEVTEAEVMPQVMREKQAVITTAVRSDETPPET